MLLYWIIGFIIIILAAVLIVKLIVPKDSNPDSNLGILEHPSTFEKQPIEYVDKSLTSTEDEHKTDADG
ncbi:hypothetical protein [Psychroserpens sp.]|uniref:hypothetical protein n=1 Tax=Psychroserpens sp. TaxID=2020870 RepID=UPI001B12E470|nr:hypothetical protein [Psychroserpens sp.]MBO6605494.1 hypothetical protein [Psychroserpens sp.]MBO6630665.1 hypothetical protein [Psychroserpens sp.]MBO6653697.1 hypothetical protein [Psychroserpens sp.]MBO6682018.1 hypothetical protein [Psychroserpens sp.]MBO6748868.1 hypothetical protein [Psychroserpens sp.]